MIITIISKLDNAAQAWTFDIREEDLNDLMTKYDGRGESVVLEATELPDDIKHYHK